MGQPLWGKKILIVEDNLLVAEDLRELVRGAGGLVKRMCASRKDALAALTKEKFDGALLDVQLQDGTCVEVARHLPNKNIPFIVVTGYAHDWLASELQRAPYIEKPFEAAELTAIAARHFAHG